MIKKFLGLAFLLAFVYGALWLGAAFWLRAHLDGLAADLTGKGYAIERSEPLFVGFPGTVGLKLTELTVVAPSAEGGWRWQANPVSVTLHPGAPMDPVIELTGTQRITGLLSGPQEGLTLNVGRGQLTLTFAQDESLENMVLELAETTIAGAGAPDKRLSVKDGALHLSLANGHLTCAVEGLVLPEAIPALGDTIRKMELAVDFTGPLPAGPLPGALKAWRDGGGTIEVRSFALDWPPAWAGGTATLALDTALQPMGAATIKFQGFFDIVAALQAKGHVQDSDASIAKIVLGMLAKPSPTGEPELSLPITVQDRKLSAGPVVLMEMPAVTWDSEAKVP